MSRTLAAVTLLAFTQVSHAQGTESFAISVSPMLALATQDVPPAAEQSAPLPSPTLLFGAKGTSAISLGAGVALTANDTDVNGYLTYHYFLVDGFEINATIGGWWFFQEDDDAAGVNPAFGFRWHFLRRDSWTMYAEFGIGLLASTDDVPADGSSFNFTPRAGVGATIALDESSSAPRLDLGVRWHHISNASQWGTDDNPARDSVMFYLGVIFPF